MNESKFKEGSPNSTPLRRRAKPARDRKPKKAFFWTYNPKRNGLPDERQSNCKTKHNGGSAAETRESFLQTLAQKPCYRVAVMNRRGFVKFLGLGVAGIAVEQAIPLGRVWSFPKEIVVAPSMGNVLLPHDWFEAEVLRILKNTLRAAEHLTADWSTDFDKSFAIRTTLKVRPRLTY